MDLDATDLPSIANHVVDQLVLSGQLPADSKGHVLKALLLKHRYVTDMSSEHTPKSSNNAVTCILYTYC